MNRVLLCCLGVSIVTLSGESALAQKYIAECAKVLTYTEVSSRDDLVVTYAYLSIKLEEMKSSGNTSGNIIVPVGGVPTSMGFSQAQQKQQQLSEQLGVKWDAKHSQAYAAKYVSSSSNSIFGQCIRDVLKRNEPILLEITASEENYVNIMVHIGPEPAMPGDLDLVLTSNGQFSNGVQRRWTIGGGAPSVLINRINPGRDLQITAQVRSHGYELGSDLIVIPPLITENEKVTTTERVSGVSMAKCGGVKGMKNAGWGGTVAMNAAPGEQFNISGIVEEEFAQSAGRPGYNLIKGQQYRIDFLAKSPTNIVFKAWCEIWADEPYSWSGRVRVPVAKNTGTVYRPSDNGIARAEERAPDVAP